MPVVHRLLALFTVITILGGTQGDDSVPFRWRSLQRSDGITCSSLLRPELNNHVNEALFDILMLLSTGDANSTAPEICGSSLRLTESAFLESNINNVCLNPHSGSEVHFVQSYYRLMNIASQMKAIGAIPALTNSQDSSSAVMRGYFEQVYAPILTSGPSQTELADAVYRLAVQKGWSYMVLMTEAEDGAMKLSQALQDMGRMEHRICFPLIITFTAGNATQAAKSLRDFAYPKMPRLTVVYAGSGGTFLTLWDLVTGTDVTYTDTEKRYQFVLVGDAFGTVYMATDTLRKRHFGFGTIFIFPGILDPNPATDQVARLLFNISNSPASMGEWSSLVGTSSRLQSLKTSTDSRCNWRSLNDSTCYIQALMYDYQLLSFLPIAATASGFNTPSGVESLRQSRVTLADIRSRIPFVGAFLEQNYTSYSLARGLLHSDRGYWQPIVKVYQSQLNPSSVASTTLMKLGELRVRQAGTTDQSYEWDLARTPVFYEFTAGSADNLPVPRSNSASVCPLSCPECASMSGKQYVEYKPGDIYIGAVVPIHNKGADYFTCSDGTFDEQSPEWSTALRFIVDLTNWVNQAASPLPPPGMDPSLVDQQFLLGVKDLLSKVQQGRTSKLKWGYVILDSCYAAPVLTNRLALLLDGRLDPLIGLNYTKFVGFVGDASSTQTLAASQILKQYGLPIISPASTSTALSDVFQYPFTMRTVASDNEIVEAMLTIIRHYQVDLITVVHATNAYGLSLKDAMLARATRDRICIAKLLVLNCGVTDVTCKRDIALQMRNAGTRYVTFLCDSNDLAQFLNYPQVEGDLQSITILATEDVDGPIFTGKNNLGVGTTMVQLVSAPEPALLTFLNYTMSRLPSNSNNLSQWDRLYFEMVQECYLTDSFVRSSRYSQPCLPSIVASHQVKQLESRTVFAMAATKTLLLGCLTAIKYICTVVTPEPACPTFFKGDWDTQLQRANLIMYGQVTATGTTAQRFSGTYEGVEWSFQKIFENRMGRTPMRLMQFRKIGSAEYDFVQFGLFDGINSSVFNATAKQLYTFERQVTSSMGTVCRTAAECGNPKCVNSLSTAGGSSDSGGGTSPVQLGLLGLLFVPGVIIGLAIFWILRRVVSVSRNDDDYANPDYQSRSQVIGSGQTSQTVDIFNSDHPDDGTGSHNTNRPLPTPK